MQSSRLFLFVACSVFTISTQASGAISNDGLEAMYLFDEDAFDYLVDEGTGEEYIDPSLIKDASGNDRHLTPISGSIAQSNTSPTNGDGYSGDFSVGVNPVAYRSDTYAGVTGTSPRSISFWIRIEGSLGSTETVVGWGGPGTGERFDIRFQNYSGNLVPRVEVANGYAYPNALNLEDFQWHHVAIVVPESAVPSDIQFYIDGSLWFVIPPGNPMGFPATALDTSINTSATGLFTLGSSHIYPNRYFGEYLDDVVVFSRAITSDEVTDLYNGLLPDPLELSIDGDLDGDGFVGINDLNIVLANWNQNVTPGDIPAGDPSGDGFVGIDDLNTILGNWNAGTPPVSTVIPEPATLSLLLLTCSSTLCFMRSRAFTADLT